MPEGGFSEHGFTHKFYLVAPALENYRYALFEVVHPTEMFPLLIKNSPINDFKADTEEEFLEGLRQVFASEKTQKVIQALIAQSASYPANGVGVFVCHP